MGSSTRKASQPSAGQERSPFERLQQWMEMAEQFKETHDAHLREVMKLESATFEPSASNPHNATTVWSFEVTAFMCNLTGNLHGGAVALIFDICTSTAIMAASREGFWDTGHVSRNLKCTYLRPAPIGSKLYVESQVVHMGKRLCMTTGVIKAEDGRVLSTCEHEKVAVNMALM